MRNLLQKYIDDFNIKIFNLNIEKNCKYGLVLIETRKLPYIKNVISNFLYYTKYIKIGLTIFCSKENIDFLKEHLILFSNSVSYVLTDVKTEKNYNDLLKSEFFYNNISYERFLLFQHDSILLKHIYDYIIFESYDYLGAGWNKNFTFSLEYGGNGGLSFRNKNACLDLIKNKFIINLSDTTNEDLFFSFGLKLMNYNVVSRSDSRFTFVESIYYPHPLGVHNPHPIITDNELKTIFENSRI